MSAPSYCTPADIAAAATGGWHEIAQRAAQDARLDGDALQATAEAADRSGWQAEVVALADSAHARLLALAAHVSRHADTFIAPRYRTPLAAATVASSDLASVCATIAVRRLYGAAATDDIRQATAWADQYLNRIAEGKISLGRTGVQSQDPQTRHYFSPRKVADLDLEGY